jgi:hypothetical protein
MNDEYACYLQSPEWKAKRLEVIRQAGGRCQTCNARGKLPPKKRKPSKTNPYGCIEKKRMMKRIKELEERFLYLSKESSQ